MQLKSSSNEETAPGLVFFKTYSSVKKLELCVSLKIFRHVDCMSLEKNSNYLEITVVRSAMFI